jgi:hypothetical protein
MSVTALSPNCSYIAPPGMKKWKRKTTSMQKAYTRTHQGYNSLCYQQDIFSFCGGRIGLKNLHVVRRTESGATPPTLLAVLLLILPLVLPLQKAVDDNAHRKRPLFF